MIAPREPFRCARTLKPQRSLVLALLVAFLASSPSLLAQPAPAIPAPIAPAVSQPPNVGEAKLAATAYYDSGVYARDLALVASEASAWIAKRARR